MKWCCLTLYIVHTYVLLLDENLALLQMKWREKLLAIARQWHYLRNEDAIMVMMMMTGNGRGSSEERHLVPQQQFLKHCFLPQKGIRYPRVTTSCSSPGVHELLICERITWALLRDASILTKTTGTNTVLADPTKSLWGNVSFWMNTKHGMC